MQASSKRHLFISYARSDGRSAARELNQFLRGHGISTWHDVRDIDPYMDFSAEIERAIESAMHVVVCLTPSIATRKDSFVRREVIYAQGIGVPITPVVTQDFPIGLIPVLLNHYTWLPVGGDIPSPAWDAACLTLLERIRIGATSHPQSQFIDPFRDNLRALYRDITAYLEQTVLALLPMGSQSLNDAVAGPRLPLTTQFRTGIFRSALPLLSKTDKPSTATAQYANISDALKNADNQLLVLGEPGSGKTTALLAFAREAIAARLEDSGEPLPLIGRLADWVRAGSPALSDWLATIMSVNPIELSKEMSKGRAMLLLDGLDEVVGGEGTVVAEPSAGVEGAARNYRAELVSELERSVGKNTAIVTCRAKDYKDNELKLPLNNAVIIRPLSSEQVINYLQGVPSLSVAVQSDPDLAELVRTPLLLSLFAFAFTGNVEYAQTLGELRAAPGELRDRIIGSYVARRFEHESLRQGAPPLFALAQVYDVLGYAAVENQDVEITHRETIEHPGKPLLNAIVDALGGRSEEFIGQAIKLHLVAKDEQNVLRFIHPLFRDHFALPFAIKALGANPKTFLEEFRIATILSRIGDCRAVDVLLTKALSREGARVEPQYHFILAAFNDPRIVRAYARTLSSTAGYYIYEWVSSEAPIYIHRLCTSMGNDVVAEILVDALRDSSGRERADYALALGLTNSKIGIEQLIEALADKDPEVRSCAAHSLGLLGDKAALVHLTAIVGDTTMENRPDHTYPWRGDDSGDPRESRWEPAIHRAVGEIAAEAIARIVSKSGTSKA